MAEVSRAIEELRELARGVRPAGLDDGLATRCASWRRARARTRIDVTDERFEDQVETAAYFVASEALANAAKHARAARGRGRRHAPQRQPRRAVRDDGVGGAVPSAGSGPGGHHRPRRRAGRHVSVTSPPGAGTEVVAELPCGS